MISVRRYTIDRDMQLPFAFNMQRRRTIRTGVR